MPQPNDLSRSLVALDQNSTIIAVIEMSQSSYGRKMRLRVGNVEVEARTAEEVEKLLKRAAEFRDSNQERLDSEDQ
jgi:hypothetical protein